MKKKVIIFFLMLVLVLAIVTVIDLIRASNYAVYPMRPEKPIHCQQDDIYRELKEGVTVSDWGRLDGTLEYIDHQYDCSDFRFVNLLRILHEFEDQIPANVLAKIENSLFNFRYWWDEPGENSMCYWSENHQILFASAEYLVGQKYPEVIFPNSGMTGAEHMEKARIRILHWLEMRWKYGFIEYNSEVYYKEDIGGLINIIDFVENEGIVEKTRIILDLLVYDVALQSNQMMLVSTSGRAYEGNRKGGPNTTLGGFTNYFWGNGDKIHSGIMQGMMYTENYTVPPVFGEIALDSNTVVIKQKNGLDLSELESEGYLGTDNRSMMMQWGMEAFSNPETIRNSLAHIRKNNMFSNDFIKDFRDVDLTILRLSHLEPTISRILDPQTNGVAIQQGNTYTYQTANYSVFTSQKYHPGTYGDQQHITGLNVGNHFSIFHTHPALEKDVKNQSPNYWVGYGHLPHAVQHKNISLSIYNISKKKGLMEKALLDYTHAYFPTEKFDTVIFNGNYVFGKKEQTYTALIGLNDLKLRDEATDDLIQTGKQSYWIMEAGSKKDDGSFEQFCERIKSNAVSFDQDHLRLNYAPGGDQIELQYKGEFMVNDSVIDTDYKRFDSPYCQADFKPETVTIAFKDKSLFLDFYQTKRELSD